MVEGYRSFGSYILFKELAADVLGHLYRAGELDEQGITRTVFLRILDARALPAREVIAGFASARRAARAVVAANVAAGATFIDQRGVPALAYEYVQAQPLSVVLERGRTEGFPMAPDSALLVVEKLSLGLCGALAVDIDGAPLVHGLLHPALVLVTTDGEALISGLGVGDRMLAALDEPAAAASLSPFLAPETLTSRTPSKRADVYSLGSILLELLTGRRLPAKPSERSGILDGAVLVHDERPLPPDIKAVLARALSERPEDRFSSVADLRKELDQLLYGGAYSPTTFNLALYMDRLFRSEVEREESERKLELAVDVAPYLGRLEPGPEVEPETAARPPRRRRRGLWIVAGATLTAAVLVGWVLLSDGLMSRLAGPSGPPTPTPEQLAAAAAEQERRLQQMVQEMVEQKMAEKEQEIRQELTARQARIEELQRRLNESQRRTTRRDPSVEEQRSRQQLEAEIAAEQQAQRQQQDELEAERQRQLALTAAAATDLSTPTSEPATPPPAPPSTSPTPGAPAIQANAPDRPAGADMPPVILKDFPVEWSRGALRSQRHGAVVVQATVNAEGGVDTVEVVRADDSGLGIPEAVVEAVLEYRFKPGTSRGVPVTSSITLTARYDFRYR